MKLLLEIHDSDIFPDARNIDPATFSERKAARAIVSNNSGQIALLKVGAHGYHKLPGGGVEDGEDFAKALQRELIEEIGCKATITGEVGEIIEYKNEHAKKQTSYCYIGTQIGETLLPQFTEKEQRDGFEIVWVDSLPEAIRLLENDQPTDYTGKFIQMRDLAFLRAMKVQRPIRTVDQLRADFLEARKRHDELASTTLQAVLAAIDNAGAVPADSVDPTSTEVPRRELSAQDMQNILEQEIYELQQAIENIGDTNSPYSKELKARIHILETYFQ